MICFIPTSVLFMQSGVKVREVNRETETKVSLVLSDKTQTMTETKKVATTGREGIRDRLRINGQMKRRGNCWRKM